MLLLLISSVIRMEISFFRYKFFCMSGFCHGNCLMSQMCVCLHKYGHMCASNGPLSSCNIWSLLLNHRSRHSHRSCRHFSWLFKKIFIKDSVHLGYTKTHKIFQHQNFNVFVDSCNLIMRFFWHQIEYILISSHCPLYPFLLRAKKRMILLNVVQFNEISFTFFYSFFIH